MPVPLTLKVFKGDQLVSTKDFDRDLIKIGRLASAHLTIDDEKVARIHAVIDVAPDGALSVTDMGTVEGTMLNGKRVMKSSLAFGDAITLGGTTIRVEKATQAPAVAVSPPVEPVAVRPVAAPAPNAPPQRAPTPTVARPPPAPLAEARISPRMRPRRRKGAGPLGVELRFLWGDQIVGEYFLAPGAPRTFTVGSAPGVNFEMGDLAGPTFALVRLAGEGAQVRLTAGMEGELHRKFGDEVLTLSDAKKRGLAQADGDAVALKVGSDDFCWVDLGGGITLELFFQPVPRRVFVPFAESVDFTVLNIFLLAFFLAALFVISAANLTAEGDEFADDLSDNQARIAKLLIKPPENQKNPILDKYEKKKDTAEVSAKRKADEGQMGSKVAPKRSASAAPKGDPNNKDQARLLVSKVFGASGGGISTIFGHQGIGGELKAAMGNMLGAAPGDAAGLGGLGLRGSGSGGGGLGDTIGIGGIGTRGRGGGTGGYGSGAGVLGGKKDVDIGITSSEPTVMGSLDKELIRKVIHSNRGQIRYCYESQLNRFPKLEGKVAIKFVISAAGSVASSNVAQTTVGNAELESCIAGRVRTWNFPKPKGGGVVVVTYPFIFKQSGQ